MTKKPVETIVPPYQAYKEYVPGFHPWLLHLPQGWDKLLVVRIICIYSIEVIFFNLRFLHRLGQVVVVL